MRRRLFLSGNKRITVFWQFFAIFIIFIWVPAIIASLFTYLYVVQLVEKESEKSSEIVIGHFASRTDDLVGTLQNDLIMLLGYSGLDRFLGSHDDQTDQYSRNEQLGAFINQIAATTANHPLAHKVYLVLANQDIAIDNTGSFSKDVFFSYKNHYPEMTRMQMDTMFTGIKMMEFTDPQIIEQKNVYADTVLSTDQYVSSVISYPFNSSTPKAYLVVNIRTEQLRDQITIRDSDAFKTAILNKNGELLAYTGPGVVNSAALLEAVSSGNESKMNVLAGNKQWQMLNYYSGRYDWFYLGLTDIEELKRPGTRIQQASAILLCFFLMIGSAVSYLLSIKMSAPIRDIKNELETSRRRSGHERGEEGNEFDVIRQWSKLLVTEHKDMSMLIAGMSPVMHEYFLGKVLLGEFRDELSVEFYAKEIGFNANPDCHLSVIGIEVQYIRKSDNPVTETDKSFLMIDLKHKIERLLGETVWLCQMRKDLLACVVHLKELDTEDAAGKAEIISKVLVEQLPHYHSTLGIGSTVTAVSELHHSYQHALQLLRHKGLDIGVQICSEQGEMDERLIFDGFLSADRVNQMLNLYKVGDYDKILDNVLLLLDSGERSNASSETVKQLSVDILNTWLRAVASDNRHDFSIEQFSSWFQRLYDCSTWDAFRDFFRDAAEQLLMYEELEERPDKFSEIIDYIQNHYGTDLTIEQLARRLNVSAGHFSRSFKEASGEKYIEYLTRCRMDAAKRLLLETDKKIDDIALEVGYLGRNSFIKTFRKYESVTPGKYREAHKSR
jgi:two-component system response regulator YesN